MASENSEDVAKLLNGYSIYPVFGRDSFSHVGAIKVLIYHTHVVDDIVGRSMLTPTCNYLGGHDQTNVSKKEI